jgi:hypothetical protein
MEDGGGGRLGLHRSLSTEALWIPITIHLPLGLAKSWTPSCAEFSIYTPLLVIIFFAQLANTVLVPVLPFMVTQMGADPIYYGLLQSAYWVVELVSAPVLGGWSDRVGRQRVILGSLLVSAVAHAVLALAPGIRTMLLARVLAGFGFQLALCRAYFAEVGSAKNRASSFGLIGVITGVALTMGPTLGGVVGGSGKPHNSAWFASALCLVAAVVALRWQPLEPVEKLVTRSSRRRWVRIDLRKGQQRGGAHAVQEVPLLDESATLVSDDDDDGSPARQGGAGGGGAGGAEPADDDDANDCEGADGDEAAQHARGAGRKGGPSAEAPACLRRSKLLCKLWKLNLWLARKGVYPLLLLNTAFRFAFSVY